MKMKYIWISPLQYSCIMLLLSIHNEKHAEASCPETSSPVVKICENGEMRNTQIYVDGSTAAGVTATECRCTILLHDGGQVRWIPLNKPGFDSCGTNLEVFSTIQRTIFGCHGGGITMNTLPAASTISLILHKPAELNSEFAADYCYKVDESTSGSNLTVRCCDPSDQVCAVDSLVTEPTAKPVTTQKPKVTTQQQTTGKHVTTQKSVVTTQQQTAKSVTTQKSILTTQQQTTTVTTHKTQVTTTTGEPLNVSTNEGKSSTPNTDDTTEESSPHSDKQHDSENGDKIPVDIIAPAVAGGVVLCIVIVVVVICLRRRKREEKIEAHNEYRDGVMKENPAYDEDISEMKENNETKMTDRTNTLPVTHYSVDTGEVYAQVNKGNTLPATSKNSPNQVTYANTSINSQNSVSQDTVPIIDDTTYAVVDKSKKSKTSSINGEKTQAEGKVDKQGILYADLEFNETLKKNENVPREVTADTNDKTIYSEVLTDL